MKSNDTGRKPNWFAALLATQLGGSIAITLGFDSLENFGEKYPEASAMLTRDSVAVIEATDDREINVNFLDGIDDYHELAGYRGGTRLGHYFEFGSGDQTAKIIGMNRADSGFPNDDVHKLNAFLRNCAGKPTGSEVKIDLRLVGDVEKHVFTAPDGRVIQMKNLVIIGYAPEKNVLVARNRDGQLFLKTTAKVLTQPMEIDDVSTWTPIRLMSDAKIFRAGRFVSKGNMLVAPISTTYDGDHARHGIMTLNLANMKASVDISDTDDTGFVITTLDDGRVMTYGNEKLVRRVPERLGKVYDPLFTANA